MFLVQACRGHEVQPGVKADDDDESEQVTIPVDADVLLSLSTTPGQFYEL